MSRTRLALCLPGGGVTGGLYQIGALAALEDTLEGLAEAVHERIRLRLTGPVAPYDFVEGQPWG